MAAFAPGSGTPGTSMTVAGNLAFQSGALYLVQLNPTSASSANVSGTATLTGGSVQAVLAPGSYVSRQYTILHADGGLGGTTFGGVTLSGVSLSNFSTTLSYTPTDVLLNLTADARRGHVAQSEPAERRGSDQQFLQQRWRAAAQLCECVQPDRRQSRQCALVLSGEAATGAQRGAFER